MFLQKANFSEYLGEIERDPVTGRILSAKATYIRWFGKTNATAISIEKEKAQNLGTDQQPVFMRFL